MRDDTVAMQFNIFTIYTRYDWTVYYIAYYKVY